MHQQVAIEPITRCIEQRRCRLLDSRSYLLGYLRDVEGFTFKQIGKHLGVSASRASELVMREWREKRFGLCASWDEYESRVDVWDGVRLLRPELESSEQKIYERRAYLANRLAKRKRRKVESECNRERASQLLAEAAAYRRKVDTYQRWVDSGRGAMFFATRGVDPQVLIAKLSERIERFEAKARTLIEGDRGARV